jgi:hypothetical protein
MAVKYFTIYKEIQYNATPECDTQYNGKEL